jgi:hypothetical protein
LEFKSPDVGKTLRQLCPHDRILSKPRRTKAAARDWQLRVNCSRFGASSPDLRLTGSRRPNDPLGIVGCSDPAEYLWARLSAVTCDLASVTLRRGAMIVPLCSL